MAPKAEPHRLPFILMVLAMVATTLMFTAWAAQHNWATSIPPTETIYGPQHSNVY
jgi:cytochrome c-type biogenesis protein CcmE